MPSISKKTFLFRFDKRTPRVHVVYIVVKKTIHTQKASDKLFVIKKKKN